MLRQQLGKYVVKPFPGRNCEMDVFYLLCLYIAMGAWCWCWCCVCAPVPVKNCLFVFSVGLINGSLTGYQSQVIWGLSLGYQPQKVGTDMCTSSFQGENGDMEWDRGRR